MASVTAPLGKASATMPPPPPPPPSVSKIRPKTSPGPVPLGPVTSGPVAPGALRVEPFPFLSYLSEYGRHLAMSDLTGRMRPSVDRYKPIRFCCEHCKLPCEDYCLGLPTSITMDNDKTYHVVLRGKMHAACVIRWSYELMFTFGKEHGGGLALLLLRFYGMKADVFEKLRDLAPAPHEMKQYNPSATLSISDGVKWHKTRDFALTAPDPNRVVFYDMPVKMLMEATTIDRWTGTPEEFFDWFSNMYCVPVATATKSFGVATKSFVPTNSAKQLKTTTTTATPNPMIALPRLKKL